MLRPMSLPLAVANRFARSFDLYRDLVSVLDESALKCKLPGLPSNAVGLQLWCVVGARESYARAIRDGAWAGFSCSLEDPGRKEPVLAALDRSADKVEALLDSVVLFDDAQSGHLIDLLEHEAAHQGQLIRYIYGLGLPIPASWSERFALRNLEIH